MSAYLGLDVGTTAVKALAINEAGVVLGQATAEYRYHQPHPGWVEQDAADWWRLVQDCLRQVTQQVGAPIKALALSTQGDTAVPLDESGRPLAPARTWMDTRTLPQVARMNRLGAQRWHQITGSAPGAFAAAASLLWWREEMPEVFARAARFALVADFLVGRLTGRPLLDAPNASRTMLFDIRKRKWSGELMSFVGVTLERLAATAESGTVVGPVLPEVAADLGLEADTRVVLGGHDQTCAAIGCGVIKPGSLLLSCGTAWVVLAATEGPVSDQGRSLQTYCHAVPGGYASLGAFAGGNLLRWFRDNLWSGEAARALKSASTDSLEGDAAYEAIVREAEEAERVGRPPLLFLPHFYGSFSPQPCAAAKGAWAGLTLAHTRGDLALALLTGVALQTAWVVESLAQQGAPSEDVRMIGGGARSRFWAQLVADALGTEVRLPAVSEAAAYGAALIAATSDGAFADLKEAAGAVHLRDRVAPRARGNEEARRRYRRLFEALVSLWESLGGV